MAAVHVNLAQWRVRVLFDAEDNTITGRCKVVL